MRVVVACCALIVGLSGCATVLVNPRPELDTSTLKAKKVFFREVGRLDKSPDNIDGYLNVMWTDDAEKRTVVENSMTTLKSQLQSHGIKVVQDQTDADIIGELVIASVRYDPVAGWITDNAALRFVDPASNAEVATVFSSDAFITPTLSSTFERLLEGTLKLWGVSSGT